MLLLLLACASKEPDDTGADTSPDTAETGDTGDSDTGHDSGQVFELGDPLLQVGFGKQTWSSSDGYWFSASGLSTIKASLAIDAKNQEQVSMQIDGDVAWAGTYPVAEMVWVHQLSASGDTFKYEVHDPPDVTFTVEGFAEGDHLFGHLDGVAHLVDSVAGGPMSAHDLTVQSWGPY